jgi:hypothetical protein
MGGFVLLQAAPLLLPHSMRWEAPVAAAPLLLPCICRRWEATVAAALLLLPPSIQMTRWRCGWRLLLLYAYRWLLLRHTWHLLLLLRHVWRNAPTSKTCAHIKTASIFQLFSIITKCKHSFSDSNIKKQIGEDGQRRTGSLYQC